MGIMAEKCCTWNGIVVTFRRMGKYRVFVLVVMMLTYMVNQLDVLVCQVLYFNNCFVKYARCALWRYGKGNASFAYLGCVSVNSSWLLVCISRHYINYITVLYIYGPLGDHCPLRDNGPG